jgi:beta-xylosidase
MELPKTRRPRRLLGGLLALVLVAVLAGCIAAPGTAPGAVTPGNPGSSYQNPVYGRGFADPAVLRVGNEYYAYGTGDRFPVLRSSDLVHWSSAGTAMASRPAWSSGNSWAPSVLAIDDRCPDAAARTTSATCYVMYYVGLNNELATPANCVGVALADNPTGPFRDHGILTAVDGRGDPLRGPIGCGDGAGYSNIDPAPFTDRDGRVYLYLSTGHSATGAWKRAISVIPLAEDLLHAAGERAALFTMTQSWEADVVEGPWMTLHHNRYYLFYSGGRFTDDTYAMSYALAASPTGPFTKPQRQPFLKSTKQVIGPGGGSVITGPSGGDWLVYHGRDIADGARTLRVDPLVWNDHANPPTVTVHGPSTTP